MSLYEGLNEGSFKRSAVRRLPICFCLDVSGSMIRSTANDTPRIQELNESFRRFLETMRSNEAVAEAADIAVLTFGGTVRIEQNMTPIDQMPEQRYLVRKHTMTPLGEAILGGIQLLELRKEAYKKKGIKYFQPWLVVLTDGEPEGYTAMEAMDEAVETVHKLEAEQKLVVFPVGVGDDVEFSQLGRLSSRMSHLIRMDADKLDSFFQFLNASSTQVVVKDEQVIPDLFGTPGKDATGDRGSETESTETGSREARGTEPPAVPEETGGAAAAVQPEPYVEGINLDDWCI